MDVTAFDLDCELDAEPSAVSELRRLVSQLVAVPTAGSERTDDVRLAVTEAVTNVVLHAYRDPAEHGTVRVRARLLDDDLLVIVSDHGQGITPRDDSPGLGVGMSLMTKLSDEFDVRSDDRGSEVSMRFALRQARPS